MQLDKMNETNPTKTGGRTHSGAPESILQALLSMNKQTLTTTV